MKVLLLNHNVIWKGTFQRCFDFAKALTSLGHSATIITNSPSARFKFSGTSIKSIEILETPDLFWGSLRTGWDPLNVLRRCLALRNQTYDLVHAFDNRPTVILPALVISHRLKCPLISDWCDWWGKGGAISLRKHKLLNQVFAPIETFFEEHFRRYADRMTVISTLLRQRAISLGYPEEKISLIPPMADTDSIFPIDKLEVRKRLGLSDYSHILIFSGFVLYDIRLILVSFRRVHQQFPRSILILTGHVPNQMLNEFSDLPIKNLGFLDTETLNQYLGASDACLLPMTDHLTNRARFPHKSS